MDTIAHIYVQTQILKTFYRNWMGLPFAAWIHVMPDDPLWHDVTLCLNVFKLDTTPQKYCKHSIAEIRAFLDNHLLLEKVRSEQIDTQTLMQKIAKLAIVMGTSNTDVQKSMLTVVNWAMKQHSSSLDTL